MSRNILFTFFTICIVVLVCGGAVPVHSAALNVTTTQDNVPGSLRAAITTANSNSENDTIYLPAGTYILSGAAGDDSNLGGDLDIANSNKITIIGAGRETTIIDGDKKDRVLHILGGTVSISGVTVRNGKTRDGKDEGEDGEDGGGIYNSGILNLTNCSIDNNRAGMGYDGFFHWSHAYCPGGGGHGGGIYNGNTLTLTDCIITNNMAGQSGGAIDACGETPTGGNGGGIYNSETGTQVLTNCTISNNISGRGFDGGDDHDVENNGGNGGGIANDGTQELSNCWITYNSTGCGGHGTYDGNAEGRSGHGGGIYNGSGSNSTLENCIIRYNYTGNSSDPFYPLIFGGEGGGIYNSGGCSLTHCTVSHNNTAEGGNGGGISHTGGTLTLLKCSITNNYTGNGSNYYDYYRDNNAGHGGGIYSTATCTMTLCTISSNFTGNGADYEYGTGGDGGFGGGIFSYGELNLDHCTVCSNSTGSGGIGQNNQNGLAGCGGGLNSFYVYGSQIIYNTIVADNQVAAGGCGPDCFSSFLYVRGNNIIENTTDCVIDTIIYNGHIISVDPLLDSLADNGGATKTHALLPGSPAIDAGSSAPNSTDQRDFPRPVDIPGIPNFSNGADIGAYEFIPSTTISGTITYGGTGLAGVTLTFSGSGGTTASDENGHYSHAVSYGWSGTLTPSKSGYTFTPANRSYTNVTANYSNQDFTAIPVVPPLISLNRTHLYFGADTAGHQTGPQAILIANAGGGTLNWTLSTSAGWLTCTPPSGSNSGVILVSVDPPGLSIGTHNGTIVVEDPNAANSPRTINITLKVYDPRYGQAPFGSFDTPPDGSTVVSSIPVTGWVIDNIGIESVTIYRNPVPGESSGLIYVGDATLVEGARPDVEALYPDYPMSEKAGWGYMMLTNFLPNQGNGTFTIHARAVDKEGNTADLGQKTIICDNAHAVKPFGAIDTPAPGGTAAGKNFVNFGWALTPQPNTIPINGSTITVWVDGLPLGHPVYNQYRVDIATLFPGYNNSYGAVGYYYLDTRKYENGVHTIQWTVTDNADNTDGIGSRYFTVQNTGENSQQSLVNSHWSMEKMKPSSIPLDNPGPVRIKKGYDYLEPQTVYPDENGFITVEIKELERIEIHLADLPGSSHLTRNTKHAALTPLPIGSTFDTETGTFYWQPGPGFLGTYEFVFTEKTKSGEMLRKTIVVKINPGVSKEE